VRSWSLLAGMLGKQPLSAGRPPEVMSERSSFGERCVIAVEDRRPGMSDAPALRQIGEELAGLFQVDGLEAFREPVMDAGEDGARLPKFALLLPQARQAHGGRQLQGA